MNSGTMTSQRRNDTTKRRDDISQHFCFRNTNLQEPQLGGHFGEPTSGVKRTPGLGYTLHNGNLIKWLRIGSLQTSQTIVLITRDTTANRAREELPVFPCLVSYAPTNGNEDADKLDKPV